MQPSGYFQTRQRNLRMRTMTSAKSCLSVDLLIFLNAVFVVRTKRFIAPARRTLFSISFFYSFFAAVESSSAKHTFINLYQGPEFAQQVTHLLWFWRTLVHSSLPSR